MPNLRQKKAAKLTVEVLEGKRNLTKGEILKLSAYSPASAHNPELIMGQKGFIEELGKYGFTADNVKKVLGGIMNAPIVYEMVTPDNQIRSAIATAEIIGLKNKDATPKNAIQINVFSPDQARAIAERVLKRIGNSEPQNDSLGATE